MKKDPVCQMEVSPEHAVTAECDGEIFYFCSEGCREKFFRDRSCRIPRSAYDLIIVGGGPAGLTAGTFAATMKINAFLIASDLGGQAVDSTAIENYMGFDFITGPELVEKFEHQLFESHYIDHLLARVEKIEPWEGGFQVCVADGSSYVAKAVLVATGMTRRKLKVPGEERFQRRGIFYGSLPDLSFVQGADVVVIGGGNSALQIVENLQSVARHIHLVVRSELTADAAVIERIKRIPNLSRYLGYETLGFGGDNNLAEVQIRKRGSEDLLTLPVRGAFIAIGLRPNSALAADWVKLNARGEIVVGPDCSTSHPGLFAAGDVTNAFGKRIVIASGEGAKAVITARQFLLDLRKRSQEAVRQ